MGQATRTTKLLNAARAFYVSFFLAHSDKLAERVTYVSDRDQQERERLISPNELQTWAEFQTVATKEQPHPQPEWNFSERFPGLPFPYRRPVIKDATGAGWAWHSYPVKLSRYFETRWRERGWEQHSPKLILRKKYAALESTAISSCGGTCSA